MYTRTKKCLVAYLVTDKSGFGTSVEKCTASFFNHMCQKLGKNMNKSLVQLAIYFIHISGDFG